MTHPPSRTARRRWLAVLLPVALLGAACGQKSGVSGSSGEADGSATAVTPSVTVAPTTVPPSTSPPSGAPADPSPSTGEGPTTEPAPAATPISTEEQR